MPTHRTPFFPNQCRHFNRRSAARLRVILHCEFSGYGMRSSIWFSATWALLLQEIRFSFRTQTSSWVISVVLLELGIWMLEFFLFFPFFSLLSPATLKATNWSHSLVFQKCFKRSYTQLLSPLFLICGQLGVSNANILHIFTNGSVLSLLLEIEPLASLIRL